MFLQAGSPAELRAYMAQYPDSRCIAGGTDITVSPSFNSIAVAFGISVGIGELISCTVLGVLLVKIIESSKALRKIFAA